MKRIIFYLLIMLMVLNGCNNNQKEPTENKPDSKENVETVNIIKQNQLHNKYVISEIETTLSAQEKIFFISWIDKSRFVVGTELGNKNNKRLYVVDINSNERYLIYEGELLTDFYSGFKHLSTGEYVFLGQKKYLVFENPDLKMIKEINYIPDVYYVDMSFDGQQLAFSGKEGIYISKLDFSEQRLILKDTGENEAEHHISPKWANDSNHILYILLKEEVNHGVGVIQTDNLQSKTYKVPNVTYAYWFHNNNKILASNDAYDQTDTYIIDINKADISKLNQQTRTINHMVGTDKEEVFLIEEIQHNNMAKHRISCYNLKTKKSITISPVFDYIISSSLSSSGDIAFTTLDLSNKLSRIYLITKS